MVGKVFLINDCEGSIEAPGGNALPALMLLHTALKVICHSNVDWAVFELNSIDDNGFHEEKIGASEGIRTLDTHVGNVMLYQAELRSLP